MNPLCTRAFARELKSALVGEVGTKPEYPRVERAFQEHTGAELGEATLNEWWHGRIPNATCRALVDNALDGLASKWLHRSTDRERLQCHLSALDVAGIAENESLDLAQMEAWAYLQAIHEEWAPDVRGARSICPAIRPGRALASGDGTVGGGTTPAPSSRSAS